MNSMQQRWTELMEGNLNKAVGYAVAALIGAAGGYIYWQQIGCSSGSCAITSNPINSTLYGAMMGVLTINAIIPQKKKTDNGEA